MMFKNEEKKMKVLKIFELNSSNNNRKRVFILSISKNLQQKIIVVVSLKILTITLISTGAFIINASSLNVPSE